MGGGHVSRPDFGMPQPDPACPLTEFYLLLQHALDAAGSFARRIARLIVREYSKWEIKRISGSLVICMRSFIRPPPPH